MDTSSNPEMYHPTTPGLGQAMIWLHVMPSMLFVKVKCRDKVVDQKLSNMVSLLYIVATSTGEIAGSYLAGKTEPHYY